MVTIEDIRAAAELIRPYVVRTPLVPAGWADDEPPLDPADPQPAPAPPAAASPPPPSATGSLSLVSRRARVRGGRAAVRLRCTGSGPCHGSGTFPSQLRPKGEVRT